MANKSYLQLPSHPAGTVQYLYPQFAAADSSGFSDQVYLSGSSISALFIPGSGSGAAWVTANIAVYAAVSAGKQGNVGAGQGPAYSTLYKDTGTQYLIVLPAVIPATGIIVQFTSIYDFVGLDALQFRSVNQSDATAAVVQTNSPIITVFTIGNGSF